jgi:hypothetical protein
MSGRDAAHARQRRDERDPGSVSTCSTATSCTCATSVPFFCSFRVLLFGDFGAGYHALRPRGLERRHVEATISRPDEKAHFDNAAGKFSTV